MSTQTEQPTFDEWKEAVLAEYGQSLSMDREQVLAYLAKRPYPPKIRFAALIVAFVVILALVQSPEYFGAAVQFEKAKRAVRTEHYEAAIGLLQAADKTVDSPKVNYLLGKTLLMTGDFDGYDVLRRILKPTQEQVEQIKLIDHNLSDADPWMMAAAKSINGKDYPRALTELRNGLDILPSSRALNIAAVSCFAVAYAKTHDREYLNSYRRQLAECRKMFPTQTRTVEAKLRKRWFGGKEPR